MHKPFQGYEERVVIFVDTVKGTCGRRYYKPNGKNHGDQDKSVEMGAAKLPFEFTLTFVENVSILVLVGASPKSKTQAYSLPPVVKMPSFKVHFHLFLTRWTLS